MAEMSDKKAGAHSVPRTGDRRHEADRAGTMRGAEHGHPVLISRTDGPEQPRPQTPLEFSDAVRELDRKQATETEMTHPYVTRDDVPSARRDRGWEWKVLPGGEEESHWPALPGTGEAKQNEEESYQVWQARLRAWQHRQRLDREQRGERWSE
jgi:hypothetical protein